MTMTANLGCEQLLMVRSEVERAVGLLISPSAEALGRCAVILESACSDLVICRPWVRGAHGNPEAMTEARRLQETVRRVSHLLQTARDYYAKWSEAWAASTSGYTPTGDAPLPVRRGLVCLTG
jgi:hypothetical protein